MRKSATRALLWLALVAGLLCIVPAFGQSETRTATAVIPIQTVFIKKNPLVRVAFNVYFSSGEYVTNWDTDQDKLIRLCPEVVVDALPSVKITGGSASQIYIPGCSRPWELRLPKGTVNPYLLSGRISGDILSQRCEEFRVLASCARAAKRGDLLLGDNEVSWLIWIPKGEVERFSLAGILPIGSRSRDTSTQIGIPIKVECLPPWLKFCPENREAIAAWMRYEDLSCYMPKPFAPVPAIIPPVVTPTSTPVVPTIPTIGIVPPPVTPVNPPVVVNVDLSAIRAEINGQLGALGATVNAHGDDIATLKTTVADQQTEIDALKNRPVPTSPRNTSFTFIVHNLTGPRWTLEITDRNGTRCETHDGGVIGARFKVDCNDGDVTFRVLDCKSGCWGPYITINVSQKSSLDYYWTRSER